MRILKRRKKYLVWNFSGDIYKWVGKQLQNVYNKYLPFKHPELNETFRKHIEVMTFKIHDGAFCSCYEI